MYTLKEFNQLNAQLAKEELFKCCGSEKWVETLIKSFPFEGEDILFNKVRDTWFFQCTEEDYLEAFRHHPKIGDRESLKKKFTQTKEWASGEQSGVDNASDEVIDMLAIGNDQYLAKYGFIFIICATDKSASEILSLLNERMFHDMNEEIEIARNEQQKITLIRLQKLIDLSSASWTQASQITTHVLDTSAGHPGKGICIRLKRKIKNNYQTMAIGVTNTDGRILDLLPQGFRVSPGHYQMCIDTGAYFQASEINGFYPEVNIDFTTFDETHYHVPLLINPFGYSTYRGS